MVDTPTTTTGSATRRIALAHDWLVDHRGGEAVLAHIADVALQRAQQRILGERVHRHPFYWSGFLLINSWL